MSLTSSNYVKTSEGGPIAITLQNGHEYILFLLLYVSYSIRITKASALSKQLQITGSNRAIMSKLSYVINNKVFTMFFFNLCYDSTMV